MSGDIAFENEVQRTISVDIRYTMFIIDKFAGATHLIDEMTMAPKHVKEVEGEIDEETAVEEVVNEKENNSVQINTRVFKGQLIPVIKEDLFEIAFKKAKTEYGVSKDQKFWWKDNVYTTEQN